MLSVTLRSFWGLLAVSLLYFSVYEMIKKGSFGPDLGPNSLQRIYSRRQKSLLAKYANIAD